MRFTPSYLSYLLYTTTMKIIGHRGARGLAPENTVAAILAGIAAGVYALELDLRATRDGVVVLCHDPWIYNGRQKMSIAEHNYGELKATKNDLTTLDEAIKVARHQAVIYLEIKPRVDYTPIATLLSRYLDHGYALKDFAILSFDQSILLHFKTTFPGLTLIVNERWSGVRASLRARQLGTRFIQMNERWLWHGFVRQMHRAGFALSPYTINSPKRIKSWQPYLYGVVTDYPDRFQAKKA